MKKKIIVIIIIIIALILLFPIPFRLRDGGSIDYIECKTNEIDEVNETQDNTINEKIYNFFATVIESKQNYILVQPLEGEEELKSSDKISIGLGENNDAIYPVGTTVKITYNGMIMETDPAKIDAIKIELKSADNFELIFNGRKDMGIKTIISKNETDKYSYNIFSLGGDIEINIDNTKYDLREALLNNKITMEEIIVKANKDLENEIIKGDMYKDGGSMIYRYEEYTILKYHTLDGNRDVYIGVPYMTINDIY